MAPVQAIPGMVARNGPDDAPFDPVGEIFSTYRHRAEPDLILQSGEQR
jgi:hypothetical protein